jgi:multidrug resistance efflux pump
MCAAQAAVVASQAMGYVVSIHAVEGDRVRRGQLLAVIDDAQPKAAVLRAQAAANGADQEGVAAEADYTLAQFDAKAIRTSRCA